MAATTTGVPPPAEPISGVTPPPAQADPGVMPPAVEGTRLATCRLLELQAIVEPALIRLRSNLSLLNT